MQPIRTANGNLTPSRLLRVVLVGAVFCCALAAARAQDGNGIHVGEPKVYDSRELTLMLDSLSQQLQNKNFIDPKALAAALGNVQGFQSTDSSNAFFANGAVGPQAALVFGSGAATPASSAAAATAASTGTTTTGTSTAPSVTINIAAPAAATPAATPTSAAGIGPQAPALPALQTPPAFNPTFGPSASDLLADETNLTYQIYNLNLLIDRSLTDRIDLQPVAGHPEIHGQSRLQAVVGFDIDLEPDDKARDAAAVVEISVSTESGEHPTIVALMPEQGSYNSAKLSQKANAFGGAVAASTFSFGFASQKRSQVFYLYRDIDTVSFQDKPAGNAVRFGWQFRPVLGRRSISPGIRHLIVVLGMPNADVDTTATPKLKFTVITHWQRYNSDHQTTSTKPYWFRSKLPTSETLDLGAVPVFTTKDTQDALNPFISLVRWIPTDPTNGVAVVTGSNFFPGTTVRLGGKTLSGNGDGLTLKSDKEIEVAAPLSLAIGGGILSGRYGKGIALNSDAGSLTAAGFKIDKVYILPQGDDLDEVLAELTIHPGPSGAIDWKGLNEKLNHPIVLIDGVAVPGTPSFFPVGSPIPAGQPAQLLAFVPSKALAKASPVIGITFPFEGPEWSQVMPSFQPSLKVIRLGSADRVRLLISSTDPGDSLCTGTWTVQFDASLAVSTAGPDASGDTLKCEDPHKDVLALDVDGKKLKSYHRFLLVPPPPPVSGTPSPNAYAPPPPSPLVGDIPKADPPPPGPSLDKDQKILVAQFSTRTVKFTGKNLDQVIKVLFGKQQIAIVKAEDKDIIISLTPVVTRRAPSDPVELQLFSDGNDPVIAPLTIVPAKPAPAPKGK